MRTPGAPLRLRDVFSSWWPLAASWLLMGFELPAVSAVMARLPEPRIHLAAYGGVVFALALLIESPIIMLLSASTALSRDWNSYRVVRRFMFVAAGALTVLHALVAFTPLFDLVVVRILGVPADIREPSRIGLQIMLPWTLSIAYRRTQQGVLIRFGHSRAVGIGTAVRLSANVVVLAIGYWIGSLPGIVVGTAAVAAGVISEAIYAGLRVHPVLRDRVRPAPPQEVPLTMARFIEFYLPLSATPLILFLAMPMTSAAMSRMPRPLDSLAAWPVVSGLVFTLRSAGFALNEVVVSLLDHPGAVAALRRFTFALAAVASALLLVVAATPLAGVWFGRVSALAPDLERLARASLWVALLLPGLSALMSLYQGAIVHSRRTGGITEAVLIYLASSAALLFAGVALAPGPGLFTAFGAMVLASIAQVAWLRYRARATMAELERAPVQTSSRAEPAG
jgi:hypothetical protein